jgi:arsenate reductase-like glutaredoxin family protein
MGVIATNKNEIRFYYSSLSSIGKQAMAFILASDKKVLAIDVSKTKVTGTQWVELANGLGMEVYQLIDTDHPDFINRYGTELRIDDQHDWLKILEKNPSVLQRPIIVNGTTFVQIVKPPDVKVFLDRESTHNHGD